MLKNILLLPILASLVSAAPLCSFQTFATAREAMQSGCCSHHGGVCGCVGGRKKCCDGALSPSCTC